MMFAAAQDVEIDGRRLAYEQLAPDDGCFEQFDADPLAFLP